MIAFDQAPEHEFEPELGLPAPLPQDERILWQGVPDWRLMAREAMHLRALSFYFGALLLWRAATSLGNGGGLLGAAQAVLWLLPLALVALMLLGLLAWLISRTSVYTITDKRVVMRIGVVLSITFNLPLPKIEAARLCRRADGSGDLSLLLDDADRIAYIHLWPHARPWHLKRAEPMMRALPDAQAVAAVLAGALARANTHASAMALAQPPSSPSPHRPVGPGATSPGQQPLAA